MTRVVARGSGSHAGDEGEALDGERGEGRGLARPLRRRGGRRRVPGISHAQTSAAAARRDFAARPWGASFEATDDARKPR